ncbi:L-threonylcarbamoyladenylate synthase [Staphylospora marina]|uniref:L-threonylcarbamoyladenylate synthase n=1 Tax=Staphylospora marina TaxID=2490858 RepID=UPI000F5BE9FC|nr:L-threonylcarbamoyladenylate synthase [Staphylospora marina]
MNILDSKETRWWKLPRGGDERSLRSSEEIRKAAEFLRNGGLVAFPTETVYGLGADATCDEAVSGIFAAKGRPSDNPLIIHLGDASGLADWVEEITPAARKLAEAFWPGPLTLVLPHRGNLSPRVTAGLPTVAVRVPSHPVARALILEAGIPVAAPSANRSGRPSPTEARHVFEDLRGRIDVLLDGGPCGVGVESSVVDVTGPVPVLLRPGGISAEEIRRTVGSLEVDGGGISASRAPKSPGMKYRHYAPRGELWLVAGSPEEARKRINRMLEEARRQGKRTGVLTTEESEDHYRADVVVSCGRRSDPSSVARALYASLRRFDEEDVDLILAETFPEEGLFHSVMNRLRKAAEGKTFIPDDE